MSQQDVTLSAFKNKSWYDIQLLNSDVRGQIETLAGTVYGGNVALMEMLFYIVLSGVFAIGFTTNASAYQNLRQISSCASHVEDNTGMFNLLAYIGIGICTVRVLFSKIFVNVSANAAAWIELIVGLVLWTLFLIQMVMAINMKNIVNDTSKCNSVNADQAKILAIAKDRANADVTISVGGFVLTSLYTVTNCVRLYMVKTTYTPLVEDQVATTLKSGVFDKSLLTPAALVALQTLTDDPSANPETVISAAGVA